MNELAENFTYELEVNDKFKNLIPPLTSDELRILEENILEHGVRDPILTWNNTIIDGHNRYSICQKHNLPFSTKEIEFDDEKQAVIFIIKNQLGRRNITDYTKTQLVLKLESTLSELAKQNKQLAMQKTRQLNPNNASEQFSLISDKTVESVNTAKQLADLAGVSRDTIFKVKKIESNAIDEIKQELSSPNSKLTINTAEIIAQLPKEEQKEIIKTLDEKEIIKMANEIKKQKAEQKKQALIERAKAIDISDFDIDENIRVLNGDFETALDDIPDNSVDLILTDPPYPAEYLPLFEKLSLFASKKLKPSGLLISYVGQLHLPDEITLLSKYLKYKWTACLYHVGETRIVNGVNVINKWKPILFFQKEPAIKFEKTFSDYFISEKPEKSDHEWQQNITVYEHIIDIFTEPNQLVVDPFLGGGTTAVACKKLKRKFIGSEINENSYKLILQRLNNDNNVAEIISTT